MIGDKDHPIVTCLSKYIRGQDGGVLTVSGEAAESAGIKDGGECVVVNREVWDQLVQEITEMRELDHEMSSAEKDQEPADMEPLDRMFIKTALNRNPHLVHLFILSGYRQDSGVLHGVLHDHAQLVDGQWYRPASGSDSLQYVINAMRGHNATGSG